MTRPWLITPLTAALFAVLLAAYGPTVPPPPDEIGSPIDHICPRRFAPCRCVAQSFRDDGWGKRRYVRPAI